MRSFRSCPILRPTHSSNFKHLCPQFSYQLKRNRHGLMLRTYAYGRKLTKEPPISQHQYYSYSNAGFSLDFTHEIVQCNRLLIDIGPSLNGSWYSHFSSSDDFVEHAAEGWNWGFGISAQPKVRLWGNLFLNNNLSYTVNPFGRFSGSKTHLLVGTGLGFKFGK
jgi:hypothetical protein